MGQSFRGDRGPIGPVGPPGPRGDSGNVSWNDFNEVQKKELVDKLKDNEEFRGPPGPIGPEGPPGGVTQESTDKFIKPRTLWCADGTFCTPPESKFISFPMGSGINLNKNLEGGPNLGNYSIHAVESGDMPIRIATADDNNKHRPLEIGFYTSNNNAQSWNSKFKLNTYNGDIGVSGNMTIPTGNLGIGTNNPTAKLDVRNGYIASSTLRLQDTWQTNRDWGYEISGIDNNTTGHDLVFRGRNTNNGQFNEHMRIKSSGNIGIGTNDPKSKLDIRDGFIKVPTIRLQNTDQDKDEWGFEISGINNSVNGHDLSLRGRDVNNITFKEYMRVKSNGNIGIGNNNPTAKLHVNGPTRLVGDVIIEGRLITKAGDSWVVLNKLEGDNLVINRYSSDNPNDNAGGNWIKKLSFNSA